MEDLKEIGYEGGKTTHGDVRQAINANSEVANGNFDELSSAVQGVAKAAQGATETAQAADAAAGEAKQTAEAAKGTAEGAAEAATEAQRVAGAAEEVAEGAAATAEAAQETATGAQSAAETAARDAATAKQDAATAKSDAASAKRTAEGAQSTAETAASNASAALEAAQAAQGTADTAKETAEAAQTAAEGAAQTASTANGTAGAAKTAADKAAEDAATAKSDAATAKSTAETAKSTAETASQAAETAKSTAETAKQTAEGAKASAEGLTGDVTAMGLAQSVLTDYAGTGEPVAAGAGAVSVLTSTLKSGELVPWHGWFTLVACYTTEDAGAQLGVSGKRGESAEQVMVPLTKVEAGERVVAKLTADPGTRTVTLESGDAVEVRKLTTVGTLTLHWAVLYESDEYGNPRRRGGSLRAQIEGTLQSCTVNKFGTSSLTATVYNERTGWFEVNGLVDMTFDDCLQVLKDFPAKTAISCLNNDYISHARTTNALQGIYNVGINFNFYNDGGETIALGPQLVSSMLGYLYNNNNNNNVRAILSYIRFTSANINKTSALSCKNLESIAIQNISGSFSFAKSPSLSWDSWKYLIDNADEGISEDGIIVTVHADVYAKMASGVVENWGSLATLASGKNITLLAKGDADYPFLTEVLWHSYAALQKKINDATNGSTIYIHTQDKQKITSSQQDNWGTLVTLAAEKNITFAQAE